ncbi:cupin domain-containing protein [Aliirhizobium smilacinae]|uniref:Cupin domain-containing protein n=1 Tax=Aliirhizobium smilacinae TaxID=1395944 RepID=A0A5C4XBT8_9HYPH|nr:cupin domain-containing protein [Rhizobium smilacinae]TNM60933.1 cupin domain-containing protein [Rhizobium smilacinae]
MMAAKVDSNSNICGDTGPMTVHFLGNLLTFHVRSAATGDKFTLIENRTAPGQGAPLHRQADDEAFYVLEGQYEFFLDGDWHLKGAGEAVHIVPGTVHAFRNPGKTDARMLIINSPGSHHEAFFVDVGDKAEFRQTAFSPIAPPDIPAIVASGLRNHIEILPPAA